MAAAHRTRSRLDVPAVRTIFGAKTRPHRTRSAASTIEAVIETPRYDLTWFKVAFGRLAVKAYNPKTWTAVDRDYEQIRIDLQTHFSHLGVITAATAT